jgi:aspartate racemase
MKTLGLIGGTTWLSTIDYYRYINEGINQKSGGKDFARCILYSFNFTDLRKFTEANDWDSVLHLVSEACESLEQIGAEGIVLCANTLHYIADRLEKNINVPIIHLVEATACEIKKHNLKKVALLGTKFTMEFDFFKAILAKHNIETVIPDEDDRNFIHTTIFDELGKNIFKPETKERYVKIINGLVKQGAEGVILGCTEIPLLIKQEDLNIPAFDTTLIHSRAAVEFAMSN